MESSPEETGNGCDLDIVPAFSKIKTANKHAENTSVVFLNRHRAARIFLLKITRQGVIHIYEKLHAY